MNSDFAGTLFGAASSGFIGRLLCHPLDTCKARLQVTLPGHSKSNFFKTFIRLFMEEGVRGLYRGLGAVLIGGIPGTCIYLSAYESSKTYLESNPILSKSPFTIYMSSGMIAEAVCCVVFVPVDVIKERMQLQSGSSGNVIACPGQPVYHNTWDAVQKVVRYEGLGGLYRGYGATLLSFGPFSAFYFLLYEELKNGYANASNTTVKNLSVTSILGCSVLASATAAFITSPLDLAKLKLQFSSVAVGSRS